MKHHLINRAALRRVCAEHGKRMGARLAFDLERCCHKAIEASVHCIGGRKTLTALQRDLLTYVAVILIATTQTGVTMNTFPFISLPRLSRAIAAVEGGDIGRWNKRGEFGVHQVRTSVTRDWASSTMQIEYSTEAAARCATEENYTAIVGWRLQKAIDAAVQNFHYITRFYTPTERDLVRYAARYWHHGPTGVKTAVPGDYDDRVANLYEDTP